MYIIINSRTGLRTKQNTTSRFNIYINKRISLELILLSLYLYTEKHENSGETIICIHTVYLYRHKHGESMQFLKAIEHANARLTIKEATEPPTFGR
jgi:hypothetical protein